MSDATQPPDPTPDPTPEPPPEPQPDLRPSRLPRRDERWPRSAPPVPVPPQKKEPTSGRGVAILLSTAAVLAAMLTARAALISSDASGSWQQSMRTEVKRSAFAMEDIRYVYNSEAQVAFSIAMEQVRAQELRTYAAQQSPDARPALEAEAKVHEGTVTIMLPSSEFASDPVYALPSGGYDVVVRLADTRAASPDALALDPDALMAAGDHATDRAVRMMSTTIPVGFAFLVGALAQGWHRRRRLLLAIGWSCLVAAGTLGLAVELLG